MHGMCRPISLGDCDEPASKTSPGGLDGDGHGGWGAAVGAGQAGATTESSSHESTVTAGSQRIDPDELQRLLDQIVAAGAPGAAARVRDEHGVTQAARGVVER
jgi:hypothetical protein